MLQGIQSAAKQWHKMLATDGDPTTNFALDGYLIGERLNASSPLLKQNAEALLAKATADHLPGYDAADLAPIAAATAKYNVAESLSDEADSGQSADRISRDALLKLINTRRSAIQHAADGTWPYTEEANQPFRKSFHLPLSRPMGL